ncbi:ATP-dependent DNA helicase Q5 [Calliopsis andreniformis]|uniref:ATP-dependent DNA helicase Q5 n=1 Tax=Calliopsis andreniformis TaxID=337506 RepID=UPI003FCD8189
MRRIKMNCDEASVLRVLRSVFGYENFKNEVQKQAIFTVNEGSKYTCISMPPGCGRSLCFQLPAVLKPNKVAVVFSPKLSTMKNHVDFLKSKQINACILSQGTYINERKRILRDLTSDVPTIVLLYCTPEMAMVTYFQKLILSLKKRKIISYIVFNEAHCLSEKGYDYRASYKKILSFHKIYGHISQIIISVLDTDEVMDHVIKILTLRTPKIFKMPIQQINVQHDVWFLDMLSNPLEHLKSFIVEVLGFLNLSSKMQKGFAIIYCKEIITTEVIKNKLISYGIPTLAYHYKMKSRIRNIIQNKWIQGEANVIITTYEYAFIHLKPIRCIVYWTVPENIPKYYRECAKICRNNNYAYSRIYFSTKEYSSVKSEIKNHTKSRSTEYIKKRLKEYNKLVSYCLRIKCRHVVISEYFGHTVPSCKTNCDVCHSKENVEIRTFKFIMYSENVEQIKYSIYETVENAKERQETEETQVEKEIVQSKLGKDNLNAIRADESATEYLINKYNLNKEVISLKLCDAGNNSKRSRGTDKTQIAKFRDVSRIRSTNRDHKICLITAKGKDQISRSASCEVIDGTEAKEHDKNLSKRSIVVSTCPEDFKSKRRKLGTENKPTDERRTRDLDRRVEHTKDNNANENASRDQATVEDMINKFKLNKDSVTLVLRRK